MDGEEGERDGWERGREEREISSLEMYSVCKIPVIKIREAGKF